MNTRKMWSNISIFGVIMFWVSLGLLDMDMHLFFENSDLVGKMFVQLWLMSIFTMLISTIFMIAGRIRHGEINKSRAVNEV